MVDSYVFTVSRRLTIFLCCESSYIAVEADGSWGSPCWLFLLWLWLMQYRQVKSRLGEAPPPVLTPRAMSLTRINWIVLVEGRNFHKKRHISCFLSPIVFSNLEDGSSVCDRVWTQDRFDKFGSSLRRNSGFAHIGKLTCRVTNRR